MHKTLLFKDETDLSSRSILKILFKKSIFSQAIMHASFPPEYILYFSALQAIAVIADL